MSKIDRKEGRYCCDDQVVPFKSSDVPIESVYNKLALEVPTKGEEFYWNVFMKQYELISLSLKAEMDEITPIYWLSTQFESCYFTTYGRSVNVTQSSQLSKSQ